MTEVSRPYFLPIEVPASLRPDLRGSDLFERLAAGYTCGYPYEVWANKKMGHRCGYVGVPKGHPWFNLNTRHIGRNDPCDECEREAPKEWRGNVSIHGGISWGQVIGDVYVIGFGCDTTSDLADPELNQQAGDDDAEAYAKHPTPWERTVKSTAFCIDECKKLCQALQEKAEAS